jgi:predicted AAA+ superfamily ATPase
VDQAFLAYEKYGGFPLVTLSPVALKDDILSSLYDTITLKDVAERAQVRDITSLRALVAFLADNIGQLVQPAKVAGVLKNEGISISNHTVENYLQLLEDAFLFYRARQYDLRGKKYLRTAGKYFIVDPGLRRTAISRWPGNYAGQLENVVYIELQRRGYTVDVGKMNTKEIDFVARKVDRVLYVQVSYEIPANSHETDNLLQLRDNYEKLLITQRHYPDIHDVDGISVVNIVDWLLRDAPSEM